MAKAVIAQRCLTDKEILAKAFIKKLFDKRTEGRELNIVIKFIMHIPDVLFDATIASNFDQNLMGKCQLGFRVSNLQAKLYIPSTLNNSNRAYTFICLGRAGRFGQC